MNLNLTQTLTATIEDFGPLALCTTPRRGAETTFLVTSAAVARAAAQARPVDALSQAERLLVLTDAGLEVLCAGGPFALFGSRAPGEPLYAIDDAAALRALLEGLSGAQIRERVFVDYDHLALFEYDSAFDATPVNFPVNIEVSDRYVDVHRAQPALDANPIVRQVVYDRGRPGSYDHVPAALHLTVALPDDLRSRIERDTREYYQRVLDPGERIAASPSFFAQTFTWALAEDPTRFGDPLGLAPFARPRDGYDESEDD